MGGNLDSPRFCSQLACNLDHDFSSNRHEFAWLPFQVSSGYYLLKFLRPVLLQKIILEMPKKLSNT